MYMSKEILSVPSWCMYIRGVGTGGGERCGVLVPPSLYATMPVNFMTLGYVGGGENMRKCVRNQEKYVWFIRI